MIINYVLYSGFIIGPWRLKNFLSLSILTSYGKLRHYNILNILCPLFTDVLGKILLLILDGGARCRFTLPHIGRLVSKERLCVVFAFVFAHLTYITIFVHLCPINIVAVYAF